MKRTTILLFVSTLMFGTLNAQVKPTLVEKTYSDLGKVLDFKVSLLKLKDLSSSTTENKLILESKSYTSDALYLSFTKNDINELINAMNSMNSTYLSTKRTSNIEISFNAGKGFEVGCDFEVAVEKTSTAAPVTKKEKVYIETKEKYYEGKIVNVDQGGKYIWKDVVVTTATPTKEVSGKWLPFIKLYNSTTQNTIALSVDEFKAFVKYLEDNVSKM